MTPSDEELFTQLIAAAGKLATVSDLAADVLSEQFDSLVRPSVEEVRAILAQCPQPEGAWDGELRDEDIVSDLTAAPGNDNHTMVTLTHKITGIARQSYTKPTVEENRAVARRSLEQAVAKRYASLSRDR